MNCPKCELKGRGVAEVTLHEHVHTSRLGSMRDLDQWSLCTSTTCDVVYFCEGETVLLADMLHVPFHKSDDVKGLVCFCFGHTMEAVLEDFTANGKSTIRESIKAACRAHSDDCPRRNPQGTCCLGNVGKVLKQVDTPSCCSDH